MTDDYYILWCDGNVSASSYATYEDASNAADLMIAENDWAVGMTYMIRRDP